MRTHLLFGVNVLHAIFKFQYTIKKIYFVSKVNSSDTQSSAGHTGNAEIRPLHHGKFSMTVTVKSGRGRLLDVVVFVYRRFRLQAL